MGPQGCQWPCGTIHDRGGRHPTRLVPGLPQNTTRAGGMALTSRRPRVHPGPRTLRAPDTRPRADAMEVMGSPAGGPAGVLPPDEHVPSVSACLADPQEPREGRAQEAGGCGSGAGRPHAGGFPVGPRGQSPPAALPLTSADAARPRRPRPHTPWSGARARGPVQPLRAALVCGRSRGPTDGPLVGGARGWTRAGVDRGQKLMLKEHGFAGVSRAFASPGAVGNRALLLFRATAFLTAPLRSWLKFPSPKHGSLSTPVTL